MGGWILVDNTWTYTWENGYKLASLTSNGVTWEYTYDADGLRTGRTDGTNTYQYIYAGDKLVRMIYNGEVVDISYAGSQPLSLTYDGATYYYVLNGQGDVIGLTNSSGKMVIGYTYGAYGVATGLVADPELSYVLVQMNPLTYRGYVYDRETKFYYLQSRYYDPELGRFINADAYASTGQGILGNNMFAYCLNNPIRYEDTQGSKAEEAEDDEDDEYETIGYGVQISGAASCGIAAGGGGIEIIVFLDFPGAQANGDPVVAIYAYGEVDGILDIECIEEIAELLLACADLMKIDGVNTLTAILANYHLEFAVTPFVVEANSGFCGVNDYTEFFQNKAITVGSFTYSTAWSDTCRTKGIGYTYIPGKPLLRLEFPTVSRGTSFYRLIWSSGE